MIHLSVYAVTLVAALLCAAALALAPARARSLMAAGGLGLAGLLILGAATMPTVVFDAPTYLGDLWTAFEAANKSAHGIASSRDYFSPIGPVYDWTFRLALLLHPLQATIVPFAAALFAALTVGLALAMLLGRASPLALSLTCLIAVAAILSPREADQIFAATGMTWLAPYNRWAWGLLVPVAMALCGPHPRLSAPGSAALGVALAILLLLKVTYGAAAVALLLVCAVLRHRAWVDTLLALGALALSLLLAEALTGQVLAHLADLRVASALPSNGLRFTKLVAQAGETMLWAALALALWLAMAQDAQPAAPLRRRLLPPFLILTLAAMASLILMQNHDLSGSPLYPLLPVLAAEWAGLLGPAAGPQAQPPRRSAGLLALLLVVSLPVPLADSGHILAQFVQSARFPDDPSRAVTAEGDLMVHERWLREDPCTEGTCWDHRRLVAGLDALRELGADQPGAGRVLALNFANPFPFFLKAPSPAASPIWLHGGRTFSATSHVAPETLFADVGYVMLARNEGNADALIAIYGDHIARDFAEARRLDDWVVYVRR